MSNWLCSCCAYWGVKPLGWGSCPEPALCMLQRAMDAACEKGSARGLLAKLCIAMRHLDSAPARKPRCDNCTLQVLSTYSREEHWYHKRPSV